MSNLNLYNQVREVPKEALKEIQAGRLRGKSDINPMWRIKLLTELFGPCGIGWKYVIAKQWLEQGGNGEISAFVNIDLHIKHEGVWSEAIPGTGGSSFVANEKNGPYVSDECFKMALTDAISVSCKALGFGADVYWDKDSTKYTKPESPKYVPHITESLEQDKGKEKYCQDCQKIITDEVYKWSMDKHKRPLCKPCQAKDKQKAKSQKEDPFMKEVGINDDNPFTQTQP